MCQVSSGNDLFYVILLSDKSIRRHSSVNWGWVLRSS